MLHGHTDGRFTLVDVSYVPDLDFNLYSLHAVQKMHLITSDALGTNIVGTGLTFPRESSGSSARATRLIARSIGGTPGQNRKLANNLLRQLRHPDPPPPQAVPSSCQGYQVFRTFPVFKVQAYGGHVIWGAIRRRKGPRPQSHCSASMYRYQSMCPSPLRPSP